MMEIIVVCEGPTDVELVCDLADRVLRETHPWLDGHDDLAPFRLYRGFDADSAFTAWKDIGRRYRDAGLHPGGFTGPALQHEYQGPARKVLRLAAIGERVPDGMIWFVDTDRRGSDDLERRNGLSAGRDETEAPSAAHVAIGVAHTKNEAWVLAGFQPTEDEEPALTKWRTELGYAPNMHPDRVPRKRVKDVADELCGGNLDRRRACWRDTPLDVLRARGSACSVATFLSEVRDRLAPLFGPVR